MVLALPTGEGEQGDSHLDNNAHSIEKRTAASCLVVLLVLLLL